MGVIAFGAVLGWWLGSRPFRARPAWLVPAVAAGAGTVVHVNVGPPGLSAVIVGLLTGAGAASVFRWTIRLAGSERSGGIS